MAAVLLVAWSRVQHLTAFYVIFAGIGVAQAMTLYDPVFAVAARRSIDEARAVITALTLWGGFASTVFVPVSQALLEHLGWRQALVVLGAMNFVVCVPLYFKVVAREPGATASGAVRHAAPSGQRAVVRAALRHRAFLALAVAFTLYSGAFAGLTYHLYPLLLERGLTERTVVALIALIGPAQVAGRLAVWWLARDLPIRRIGMATAAVLPATVLALLVFPSSFVWLSIFALVYGAANGIETIVRGLAVPELVTKDAYGELNGILAVPTAAARAVAPVAAAALWSATGSYDSVLKAVLAMATLSAASFWCAGFCRNDPGAPTGGQPSATLTSTVG